jgi:hypothetical protein
MVLKAEWDMRFLKISNMSSYGGNGLENPIPQK